MLLLAALMTSQAPGALRAQTTPDTLFEPVRATVHERVWVPGVLPSMVLEIQTVRQYSCLGFAIRYSFARRKDTLTVVIGGIERPKDFCANALGPATMGQVLVLPSGRYVLLIQGGRVSDQLQLVITDSSSNLVTRRATFVEADERFWWRYPPHSVALFCENSLGVAKSLCADVHRWLAAQPGIVELYLPPNGVNPYRPDSSLSGDQMLSVFRYKDAGALEMVRGCFSEIEAEIRETVGVVLTIRTWTGDQYAVWSHRAYHEPHISVPERVTTGPRCAGSP